MDHRTPPTTWKARIEQRSRITVDTPDPLRHALNRGMLHILPVLALRSTVMLAWYLTLGTGPALIFVLLITLVTVVAIIPSVQRGKTWGIQLLILMQCGVNALSLGGHTFVGGSVLLLEGYSIPVFIAALFLRPRAGFGALALQALVIFGPVVAAGNARTFEARYSMGIGGLAIVTQTTLIVLAATYTHHALREYHIAERVTRQTLLDLEHTVHERTNALKEVMTARERETRGAVHDLRSQYSIVQLQTEIVLIEAEDSGVNAAEIKRAQSVLKYTLQRQQHLLDAMMDATLLATGHLEVRPTSTDVAMLLATHIHNLQVYETYHNSGCVFTLTDDPHEPNARTYCDEKHLSRIYYNVLDNARKYRRTTEYQAHIAVVITTTPRHITTTITDNGRGIAPEQLALLGGEFQRLDNPDVTGIGLGLSVCYRLVRANHGTMHIQSEKGQGTTVTIVVPRIPAS